MAAWTRRAGAPGYPLVVALLAGCAVALGGIPSARASSYGPLSFTPSAGPVGTQVTLQLSADVNTTTTFQLSATTTPPDQGFCVGTTALPGVAPVEVSPGYPTTVQFAWPAELSSGKYWLCAIESDGNGGFRFESVQPFTVTDGPAASPTPAPPPTAVVDGPTSDLLPGAVVVMDVSNWFTDDGTPPTQVRLLSDDGGTASTQVQVTNNPAPGEYIIQFTLPAQLSSGHYSVILSGGSFGQVPASDITLASTSAPPAPSDPSLTQTTGHQPVPSPGTASSFAATPISLVVAALLALAVALLVAPAARRRFR